MSRMKQNCDCFRERTQGKENAEYTSLPRTSLMLEYKNLQIFFISDQGQESEEALIGNLLSLKRSLSQHLHLKTSSFHSTLGQQLLESTTKKEIPDPIPATSLQHLASPTRTQGASFPITAGS